jgi:UDP-N-acetylmuramate dehydrogenase
MAAPIDVGWIDRLPPVRGRLEPRASLAKLTWFGVGGPADMLFRPADRDDLVDFMAANPADVPVTVIGVGSNLLVRDGGVRGVTIRLGRAFAKAAFSGVEVTVGAGASDVSVALDCARNGLAGLEFLRGIPGSIGGALCMNAGAYDREISDVLISALAVDGRGTLHRVKAADLGLRYRHSGAPADWIFVEATLAGEPADPVAIAARMTEVRDAREATQPVRSRTGGSTFKNPPGNTAWALIDAAGCRGLCQGGAMVSEQHCNFLINTGDASAADIEGLGAEVRRRVLDETGVELEWELRCIGEPVAACDREERR